MVLFKDLNSSATDLLQRDFSHEKPWEVEFKHRAKNPVFTINSNLNDGSLVNATSTVKYTVPRGSLETRMGTAGTTADIQYRTPYINELTLGVRYDRKNETINSASSPKLSLDTAEVSAEYVHPGYGPHVRFGFNPLFGNWNLSSTTGFVPAPNWMLRVGIESSGSTDWRQFQHSFGAALSQNTKQLTWTSGIKSVPSNGHLFGNIVGNVFARASVPGAAEYGAEITHSIQTARTQVAFAGLWYLDQPVGGGKSNMVLKMKMTHDAKIAAVLKHKFSDALTASLGAQVCAAGKSPEATKCGVKIHLTA